MFINLGLVELMTITGFRVVISAFVQAIHVDQLRTISGTTKH
jgi:hypothetical protein